MVPRARSVHCLKLLQKVQLIEIYQIWFFVCFWTCFFFARKQPFARFLQQQTKTLFWKMFWEISRKASRMKKLLLRIVFQRTRYRPGWKARISTSKHWNLRPARNKSSGLPMVCIQKKPKHSTWWYLIKEKAWLTQGKLVTGIVNLWMDG